MHFGLHCFAYLNSAKLIHVPSLVYPIYQGLPHPFFIGFNALDLPKKLCFKLFNIYQQTIWPHRYLNFQPFCFIFLHFYSTVLRYS